MAKYLRISSYTRSPSSYMTLQLHFILNFLIYEENECNTVLPVAPIFPMGSPLKSGVFRFSVVTAGGSNRNRLCVRLKGEF
jgi:hypothetical protein